MTYKEMHLWDASSNIIQLSSEQMKISLHAAATNSSRKLLFRRSMFDAIISRNIQELLKIYESLLLEVWTQEGLFHNMSPRLVSHFYGDRSFRGHC